MAMPLLTVEMVQQIQLHLKPRHLLKWMLTCREAALILNSNEEYWIRVAVHVLWRDDCDTMNPFRASSGPQKKDHVDYYDFLALDRGYYWAMEQFLAKVESTLITQKSSLKKNPVASSSCLEPGQCVGNQKMTSTTYTAVTSFFDFGSRSDVKIHVATDLEVCNEYNATHDDDDDGRADARPQGHSAAGPHGGDRVNNNE